MDLNAPIISPNVGCPYGIVHIGYANDAMEMIGHYHIFMTDNMGIFIGQLKVFFFHHPSRIVQLHHIVHNITEQRNAAMYTDGNEIKTILRIIVFLQTDGTAMMYIGVV